MESSKKQSLLPIIAIVGPPNAGKSSLLNKIAGKHMAITSEVAGTTRDRQYVDVSWENTSFTLVDTAGLSLEFSNELEISIQKQLEAAIEEASMLILLADGKEPASAIEPRIVKKFRSLKKPICLAINKVDSPKIFEEKLAEFSRLGIKDSFTISAITGKGIGDLLDFIALTVKSLGKKIILPEINPGIAVSIVGKPNVGKSSLFNAILKEDRVVVSPIPGTTRTAIDSQIKINGNEYTFIDTAGLKKKEYRQIEPDVFSGFQTFKSVRRSDVCFFLIDAAEEITKQDQRVAQEIFSMEKGCIIIVNKIDLYQGKEEALRDYISHFFPFLWMCPAFFVSAKTGQNLNEAVKAIKPIYDARNKKIDSQILAEYLERKLKTNPPKLLRDQKRPKVFSLRQIDVNPPTFQMLVNHPAAISMQFRKFLENSMIKELGFWGTPIKLKLLQKDKALTTS
jgi:GTPase